MKRTYTDEENRMVATAYVAMAVSQFNGRPFKKAAVVRHLMGLTGRTRGSIEAKFMNYSAAAVARGLLPALPDGYVQGYKPASNAAKSLGDFLAVALHRSRDAHALIAGAKPDGFKLAA